MLAKLIIRSFIIKIKSKSANSGDDNRESESGLNDNHNNNLTSQDELNEPKPNTVRYHGKNKFLKRLVETSSSFGKVLFMMKN
jgi:hypothetical protein